MMDFEIGATRKHAVPLFMRPLTGNTGWATNLSYRRGILRTLVEAFSYGVDPTSLTSGLHRPIDARIGCLRRQSCVEWPQCSYKHSQSAPAATLVMALPNTRRRQLGLLIWATIVVAMPLRLIMHSDVLARAFVSTLASSFMVLLMATMLTTSRRVWFSNDGLLQTHGR